MIPRYGEWDERYRARGLTIVGVHAPETADEADIDRLRAYATSHAIGWRIVVDPDFEAWNRFHVQAWPTAILIGRDGRVRSVFVGDDRAETMEREIRSLIGS